MLPRRHCHLPREEEHVKDTYIGYAKEAEIHHACNERCSRVRTGHSLPPLSLPLHQGSYCHAHLQNPPCTAYTPMMDFPSWSQAAVLSPSQCPPQRPEEGNVERVMTIPLSPVTSCIALVGTQVGILKKGWERKKIEPLLQKLVLKVWWQILTASFKGS